MAVSKPTFFRSAAQLRAWLEEHHADRTEILLGFYKKSASKTGVTYAEALDEALCFGWIDGHLRSIDDERYERRFTPRTKDSIWSKVNVAHVERLTAQGRMRPAGISAFEARTAKRTGVYSFEQSRTSELDPDRAARLNASPAARAFFESQAPSYRRTAAFWVMSAKKDETRDRRLEILIASSEQGQLAPPFAFGKNATKKSPAKDAAAKKTPAKKTPAKKTPKARAAAKKGPRA